MCGEGLADLAMVLTMLVVLGRDSRILWIVRISLSNPTGSCRVKWSAAALGRILSKVVNVYCCTSSAIAIR